MKQEFIDFLNALMEASPDIVEERMTDTVKDCIAALTDGAVKERPVITDNGKVILKYMQSTDANMVKTKDIAAGLGIPSRGIAGTLRKLVNDGFCDKFGTNPCVYSLTEKGKNFNID